jgi:hypothetical protein
MSIIVNNPTRSVSINQNYFKNAAFNVSQGSTSGTVSNSLSVPTASLGYPGETEWAIAASGNSPAYAFSSVNQSLTLTGAASTTAIHVLQRIESVDAIRLSLKTVTLSVELSNSLLTTVTWELFRPTTTADTHGTISSPTQTLIAAGSWTVTSTLTRYSTTVTLPTEVSNGLEVRIRVGAQTSGTWVIARPKLEEGSVATAFTCDDVAVELTKCQRYFRNLSQYYVAYIAGSGSILSETLHIGMFSTTRVRTLITSNPVGGAAIAIGAVQVNEGSTRVTYTNNAGAGYYGGNPIFTVAAHIP